VDQTTLEGYRLSPQQTHLWQRQQALSVAQCLIRIDGPADAEVLRRSVQEVVKRHDVLRTSFERLPGMGLPLQVIGAAEAALCWTETELHVDGDDTLSRLMKEEANRLWSSASGVVVDALFIKGSERHYLCLTLPALCADRRTLHNIFREMASNYANGRAAEETTVQYVQFSEWQHQLLEELQAGPDVADEQTQAPTKLTLPFDGWAKGSEDASSEFVTFNVDDATTTAIEALSVQGEFAVEDFLLTCWQILLWRLTDEERVAVLKQFDGRRFPELHDCYGLIDSYFPVLLHCTRAMRFRDAVRKVAAATRQAKDRHYSFPWQQTRMLQPQQASEDPLPIGFVFEERREVIPAGTVTFSMHRLYSDCERFQVQLAATNAGSSLQLTFHHRSDLLDSATKHRIGRAYLSLLADAAHDPEAPIGKLNIVADEERQRLLAEGNATVADYACDSCIPEHFEAAVERAPDAVAVQFQYEQLSFRELNRRANQLAHYLRRKGVGPETRVALLLDRSVEMIVAVLAVMKAGGAYLPLDPASPEERLLYTLEDAQASLLITETILAGYRGEGLSLEEARETLACESDANPINRSLPENLAYIIYTSGSTGKPKGVMIQHRSVVNLFRALNSVIYDQHKSPLRVSVNAPLTFDASVKQFVQLLNGHILCLIPEEVRPNGEELLALISAAQIDVLDCTPSQLKMLLAAGLINQPHVSPLLALVGGEAIDESIWESLVQRSSNTFYNVYGPTECTVDATVCRVTQGLDRPLIGRPLSNVQAIVLDWNGAPVLPGVCGELCLAGEGVARAYTGDPALTAERFIPNCFTKSPGARLYRTGDYARQWPDGNIAFVGRQDGQVKLRGLRIELGEIEAALREHPSVADACVVLREDQPGNRRLVGYTVAKRKDASAIDCYARYELRNGLAIAHQNRTDTTYLYQEIFEDEVYLRQGIKLPERACVFDVGANIGLFTIFVAERCPDARIYAFEPLAPIFDVLRINSKLSGANATLFPFGLSSVEKSETFTYYPLYPSRSGLAAYADAADEVDVIKKFLANKQQAGVPEMSVMLAEADDLFGGYFNGELLECRVRRLSDVIREEEIDRIDLLKIDVQRAELDVLEGINDDDWEKIRQVVMEVHDAPGTYTEGRLRKIVSLLEEHSFQTTAEQDSLLRNTDRYTVYAIRSQKAQSGNGGPSHHSGSGHGNGWKTSPVIDAFDAHSNGDASITAGALHEFLSRKVPEYMIPAAFVFLDTFPLNRNGKINRQELPAPVSVEDNETKPLRSLTQFEELLALIWMDVLGVKHVGPQDNFFEQGGHSLLATRLISRVRENFSIELPLRSVFESPTLEGLAQRIAAAKHKTHESIPLTIAPAGRDRRLPLSFAQERLWFLNQLEPNSFVYNCPCALSLTGPLNLEVFEKTLTEIVRRHESLRTTFSQENGEPYQVIHPAEPVRLEVLDLSGSEDGEVKRRELIAAEAREPFDLSNGPLFRVRALKLSEQEHVILFTTHHIISDAWSMGILVREVAALYQTFSEGEPSPLSELYIQYADFAVWQNEYLEGQELDEQLNYWRGQLQGAPALLELPSDRPRPAVQTYRGASRRVTVPRDLTVQLRKVCRTEGVTLFMLLLAAFKVLLYRYTGQTDIVVGTDIAGRDRQEIEGLVGFFINQLALRTQLRGGETFRDLLQREREICLEAFTYQAAPFERVVEELNPVRSLSHSPIFQVSFTLNNTPLESAELTGTEMRRLDAGGGIAKFDLTLTMAETGDHLGGAFEYNADLFDAASIDRIAAHFETLLGRIVAETETRIDELSLLGEAERAQFLTEWNDTSRDFSASPALLHGLFEAQAKRCPDSIAAVRGERSITYAELDQRANTLAKRLRAVGVGPERLAGVLMNSSIEMLVAMLGVLKAGGGYVLLDPEYPLERLLYMLTDANVTLLLTQEEIARTLDVEAPRVPVLCVDSQTVAEVDCTSDVVEVSPENVAYVLYTSGSTGQPKGVVVNHRAIVNFTLAMCDEFGLRDDDKMLQFASPSFDVLLEEVFPALACGACIVFVENRESLLSCAELTRTIERYGITGCELPAPYWHELVAHLQRSQETAPPTLRLLLVGCERPSMQCITQWREWGHSLIYVFGITETTITSTLQRFENPVDATTLKISIGRPVANTVAYVLDHRLEPVPIGVTAELYLGGEGVSRGYLNRGELTAAKFIPHLFSNEPGARLYKTGDMARYLADGRIEFISRVDEQVKISGYRVEPGEIQAAIKSYAGVLECFVDARRDEPSGQVRLVGYVVCGDEKQFESAHLRNYLREKLPDYMIPSCFVALPMLPLTTNGKIDRHALPAPDFHTNVVSDSQLPVTPAEELVAEIFAKVLRVERVGRHQDFFELGGHSLLATQLVSRLREAFAVELPLRSVFETPNVADLSRRIEAERRGGRSVLLPPLKATDRDRPLPLSFAQQRLWFLEQLEPESVAYNVPAAMRITGPLNLPVLERAFTEIVRRHESLRTIFPQAKGEAYQVVLPAQPFVLAVEDLTPYGAAEREQKAAELTAAEARRPFDLAVGPVFRMRVIKLSSEEHVMLFTMHHIISDGWSMGVLVREVATLYDSFSRGEASPLGELAIQYGDYAVWQREYLEGEVLEEQLRYWRKQLQGAPALLELPTDRPRPSVQIYRGASLNLFVPQELTERLRALCREQGVTLFMLLSAAFKVLLYRYSGQRDIVIGTDIAGRNRPEIEGLVGFFINQLALRIELRDAETFRELLRRERETCLQAFTHQDAPFERVVEELNPVRSLSHTPLFQVSFSFDMPSENAQLTGLEMRPFASAAVAKFDLTLTMTEIGDQLRGAFLYNVDLFDATSMARMAAHFQTLLGGIVTGMETPVSKLPLFSETERVQLLTEWNNTAKDYSEHPALLHGLFEVQARRSPDAVAAVCCEQSITYAELDHRANTLARRLRVSGVGPEQVLGVLMDGSIEMLTAMLGVLKAGGGYLPLDPRYPCERLLYMLNDARVRFLLTRELIPRRLEIELPQVTVLYADSWTITAAAEQDQTIDTPDVSPENTAYVIYTSGSTGQPKGVVVSHRAITNYTLAMCDELELRADDRMLQFASPSFDVLLEELFPALASGACVVFVEDRERLLSCDALSREIAEHGITACELPTPYWHELVAHLTLSGQRAPETLRMLMVGCERPSIDCIAQWAEWGHSWIYVFGITETTITSTLQRFDSSDHAAPISIGKPIANTEVYILDQQHEPVPIGVTAELYLGGTGLACGYLNRAELTGEKFIPHPFSKEAGARLYQTGDNVRYLADGRVEFIGRVDNQVKIRGYRVELAEIEAMLSLDPAVQESVVVALSDGASGKRLIAYVAMTNGAEKSSGELKSFLKERLPDYMVPSVFVFLERLPLTVNGKVNRSALPAPEANANTENGSPATPIEELLAAVWSELLRVEHVGLEDDFFELGGHSLLATQLISRVRESFGVELSLRSVFDVPTFRSLAREIETALRNNAGILTKRLLPVKRTGPLPLSFAQQRLWFMHQLEPDSAAYNVPAAMRIIGPLKLPVLEESFTEVVRRHESLRTIFPHENGAAYQLNQPARPFALTVEDLFVYSAAEREERAAKLAAEEARRPFDLAVGPLFRVRVLRLADEEHIMLFTMHHIISDAWSTSVLAREVATLYNSFSLGEASPLAELAIQYGDYAVWQREHLEGVVLEEQLRYWRDQLQGAPALLELPTDRPRPAVQTYRGASRNLFVPQDLTERLRALCREQGVTLFMLLLAAFKVLLYRYSGQTDITVGTPLAGRDRSELLGLVGFFANTLALRSRISAAMSFRDLLRQVRQASVDAYVHQDVPFEKLVEELAPERATAYTPLFQVMFAFEDLPQTSLPMNDLQITPLQAESATAKFDLTLVLVAAGPVINGTLEYSTDLFYASTIEKMLGHFQRLLLNIVSSPDSPLNALEMLSEEEVILLNTPVAIAELEQSFSF
jgi:amino acid adenylation domain-containing protein/FkbM family methyltransferase